MCIRDSLVKGHYIRFGFDNNGIIDEVTYLGDEQVAVQSLVSFIGLAQTFLNKLDTRFASGLIPNIAEFLSENSAIALYHEFFSEFRHKIKNEILNHHSVADVVEKSVRHAKKGEYLTKNLFDDIKTHVDEEVVETIQKATLDFISKNLNHLPMYYVPGEEFKQSIIGRAESSTSLQNLSVLMH
eukprot:TRINITY_DN1966_c0_g1_i11.p1 TRINITY_DN1966_c0_g1~~TRINITY_DN1966_c0_g1_i11.p1  ORF type:complete len:184 (+),score=33.02 TRINITY_DN1966_c0_g1_i11:66-617(+)